MGKNKGVGVFVWVWMGGLFWVVGLVLGGVGVLVLYVVGVV